MPAKSLRTTETHAVRCRGSDRIGSLRTRREETLVRFTVQGERSRSILLATPNWRPTGSMARPSRKSFAASRHTTASRTSAFLVICDVSAGNVRTPASLDVIFLTFIDLLRFLIPRRTEPMGDEGRGRIHLNGSKTRWWIWVPNERDSGTRLLAQIPQECEEPHGRYERCGPRPRQGESFLIWR